MSDAATEPVADVQLDPHRAEPTRPVPPRIASLLSLVHRLVAYGENLTGTLLQHAAALHLLPCFEFVARIFGTTDLARILARVRCGLLRAAALEARLRRRAASGRDLKSKPPRPRSPRKPRPKRAVPPGGPAQDLDRLPTPEEIEAEVRRRPIGAVLVDICLDLGIVPAQMDCELRLALIDQGGGLSRLLLRNNKQSSADPTEASPGLSEKPSGSPSSGPIPPSIPGPTIVFPPWPALSPQPPSPMSAGLSQGCTGPP